MKLRPYQERAVTFLYERDEALLFVPMGGGKTAMVCRVIAELIQDNEIRRALIVAPKRVAQTVWPSELDMWFSSAHYGVALGTARQRAAELHADIVITNYENLIWMLDQGIEFDMVVFDEITRMKSSQSKRFKAYIKKRKKFRIKIGMTGTPTTQGLIDLYGQVKCIDGGAALGGTMTAFRADYFDKTGPEQWEWSPRKGALDRALDRMHHLVFQISPDEYENDLPDVVTNIISVELPPDVRHTYDLMEREYIVSVDDEEIVALNGGAKSNKLQQIANGFIYGADSCTRLHDAKLDALDEIIASQQGSPVIVVYKYAGDLQAMRQRHEGTVITAKDGSELIQIIDNWNAGRIPILYVHPMSAGHGLNLQFGGNTIIWYGHTWSAEEHDQTIARLRRSGQGADKVFCHYIVTADTVDGDVITARENKINVQKYVNEGIRIRCNTPKQSVAPAQNVSLTAPAHSSL